MHVYLLAHQDDELFCLPLIESDVKREIPVAVVYLTDGAAVTASCIRDAESYSVLVDIEVSVETIFFLGSHLSIADGHLHLSLSKVYWALKHYIDWDSCSRIYLPCYEGGHQDHDSISWLVACLSREFRIQDIFQFPLYNSYKTRFPLFNVLTLLPNHEPSKIFFKLRLRHLKYILTYRSQFRSWMGLTPPLLIKVLAARPIWLVQFDPHILRQRPHPGELLYEQRGQLSFDSFAESVNEFVEGKLWK